MHAPGTFEFFRSADKRLTKTAEMGGKIVKQVEKVYAWIIKGTRILVIKPAPLDDLTAYPVHRTGYKTYINLVNLLTEAELRVETGWKERHDVAYIPKESPLWPGLVIDLGDVKERKRESHKKATEAEQNVAAAKQPE